MSKNTICASDVLDATKEKLSKIFDSVTYKITFGAKISFYITHKNNEYTADIELVSIDAGLQLCKSFDELIDLTTKAISNDIMKQV